MDNIAANQTVSSSKKSLRQRINLTNFSIERRYEFIKRLIIPHPRFNEICTCIAACHKNDISDYEPECMSLFGPTRVGKSTIAKQYVKKFPPYEKTTTLYSPYSKNGIPATVKCIPVLYVVVDCPATIGSVINSFFEALGQLPSSSRNYEKEKQLKILIKNCGVELIIFDEVQHFVDRKSFRLLAEPSDWLKKFIIEMNIPVLLVGTHEGERIFNNPQLRGRFMTQESLYPFNSRLEKDKVNFIKLMSVLDAHLPLKEESTLSVPDTWQRVYVASGGRMSFVMELIKRSTKLALEKGFEVLNHQIMGTIFEKHLSHQGNCEENPFMPGYDIESVMETYIPKIYDDNYQPASNNRMKKRKQNDILGI